MMLRIVLADDHRIMRQGLAEVIAKQSDMEVVGQAENGQEAVDLARRLKPNVVVMDVALPEVSGTEATRIIVQELKDVTVLALSMHGEKPMVSGMIAAGAKGYLLKTADVEELIEAIRATVQGRTYFSREVVDMVVDDFYHHNTGQKKHDLTILTPREREILIKIAQGLTSKQIADELDLSTKTVLTHRVNLMRKLDVHNSIELTRLAIRTGLITP